MCLSKILYLIFAAVCSSACYLLKLRKLVDVVAHVNFSDDTFVINLKNIKEIIARRLTCSSSSSSQG